MCKINYIKLAQTAQLQARETINLCRRSDHHAHYTQRSVEVIAVDDQGERIGDPLGYLDVKQISGKLLASIVIASAPAQWDSITVQGGINAYNSFADFMRDPDDYYPQVDSWAVNSNDISGSEDDRIPRTRDRGSAERLSQYQ
jgi:hypothetical protein